MKKIILIIFCFTSIFLLADPPNWQPITGTQYSMIMFARIVFNGDYFDNTGDNMAAAFGPGGETDCRDIAGWEPIAPEGFWYFNIVGNLNGEEISFKIYDDASDTIYDCDQTVVFDDNATLGSPTDPVILTIGSSMITGHVTLITTTLPSGNIEDVEVSNGFISVSPDADGDYELPVDPGVYNITATLSGYNSVTLTDIEVIQNQNTENIDFTLIDWEQITGTQYSMVLMSEVIFSGVPIVYDGVNQIGAFGPGGTIDCRGIAFWQEPNPPYWDGYWHMTIVGNVQNEDITFQVYESSTSAVYECLETVTFENNVTLGSPETPYVLNVDLYIEQTMDLGDQWNWISFYVHPDDIAISSVFDMLGANVYQVKNQTESSTYFAASQSWVGSLSNISDGEAYLVFMNDPFDDFTIIGEPISIDTPIPLTTGWNWVAFYPRTSYDLNSALGTIEENVVQVKNQSQSANYINPPGAWVGDLIWMEPNIGYKIDMSASDQLIYGPNDVMAYDPDCTDDPPVWNIITGTEYSMVVMASIIFEDIEFTASGDNMVGAFGPDGEADCRSVAVWQEPNPPYYEDGFWYFTVVGDTDDDEISFMIYDEATDAIYTCNETVTFENNATLGQPDEPMILTCDITNIHETVIESSELNLNIYPNPFNPSTTISFTLTTEVTEDTEISIYNVKGQKVKVLKCSNSFAANTRDSRSNYSVTWNGTDQNNKPVASGVYYTRLKAGSKVKTQKMLLMK